MTAEEELALAWEEVGGKPDPDEEVDPEVATLADAIRVTIHYERDKADDAREQLGAARLALAPFAKLAEAFDETWSDEREVDLVLELGRGVPLSVRVGDLRRAKELA